MHGENKDIHPDRSEVSELKRHLRRVEALAEIGSWKFDLDTRKVYTSEKTREIYGLEGAEWSIEQVQKVPLPEYRQMLDDALRDLVKNNTPYDVEFEIKRPADGAIRHIHSVAEYDAEHNLIIGTLQDRTEHWHARNEIERHIEQLQESESYQRAIIQTTSDGFWMLDNKGTILDVNEAYCKMSGYTRDELTGRNISDVDRDESAEDTAEHIKKIITEGTDTFEAWHCRKDGTWWPLEVSSTHFDNGGGRFVCFGRDLTQRKIRENTLRESQQRLQMAVEGANIGLWDWHVEAEHVSFSETWAEMFGYKKDELESRVDYFLEHVHPDDRSLVKQRLQEHLDGKIDYYESEHRMRTKSDDYIWTLDRGKVVERNESGEPIRVIGLITNINKVKTVEESLRESEKKWKNILVQTPQIGIALDPQSCITFANQHFLEASGYREDELIGRNWFDLFIPEEVRAQVKSVFAQSMESRETAGYSSYENEILTKSGERRFVAWSNVISKDEAGNIIDVTCLGIDLTERRRAEKAVRENEERFQRMLAVVPDMVSIQDTDMHILYSNWQGFGDVPEEKRVRGIKCHKAYRDLDKICPDCRAKRVIETGKPLFEERHLSDGTWVDLRVIPMFDNDGNVEMFMEWVRDISESRSLQEQLTQSQKMESVGRLAGGVAHDFNNMLNVILGHAELTLEDLPEDSPVRESLTEIEKSAKRSADLTRQLLAFARKQTIAPKVIDLNQTVEPMLKMLRRLIGEDIDLEWKPTQSPDRVRIDPSQVDQLLVNLCVNARDAIGKNNGKVTIETSSVAFDEEYCAIHAEFRPGQYVMLAVSDDGCGMDKETRDHIFEPFYTTKQAGLGTGLGLSTVYGIVKQNEAFINVYSEPDEGTSFQLYLPVYHAKPNQATQDTLPVTNQKGGNETLLLVEDEMAILHLAKNALQRQGYHVLAAGTPVEAMAMARDSRKPIDLLLTDVVMPEMNGRELAKQILTLHPEVERLFMSGYTADVIAHHGVLEEGINFIQKPFSPKKLHAKIREILDARIT